MWRLPPKWSQGASLFGSRGEVDGRGSGGFTGCEAGGWAWGFGGAGEVAPVGLSGAEGDEGVALGDGGVVEDGEAWLGAEELAVAGPGS